MASRGRFGQEAENKKSTLDSLEQIIKGFCRAVRRLGLGVGLALDGHARREEWARVADILRADSRRNRLVALEARTGVERLTLRARAKIGAAPLATGISGDREIGDDIAATRAPHDFPEAGHIGHAAFQRVPLDALRTRLGPHVVRRLAGGLRRPRPLLAPAFILVATLTVLAI